MLGGAQPVAFLAITDVERAKAFYGDVLGLRLISDDPFALVFDLAGVSLRLQKLREFLPHSFTSLGWQVDDATAVIVALRARGVEFERYGFIEQDADGLWTAPGGTRVAWFKDPDGNLLSLTQHAAG
ncbi:VOC family protein [Gemmatimonas groenlandica]|uniref:VOC family protein n=2 Tax=Gemmatimonas groenlandica TaxID=2732249 RepID=A0A6M4IU13_9BACT|nr:VOC family protein [Gemmatimonas groenlandica]